MDLITPTTGDPVPWLTKRWISLGGPTEPLTTYDNDSVRGALGVLNAIVGALSDDAHPYSVSVGSNLGASTDLKGRNVQIGLAPLSDVNLTLGQRVAITVGLAYHEVAHIRHTRKTLAALDAFPGNADAQRYSNIAEDVRGERLTCIEFPGLAETLPVLLDWVGGRTVPAGTKPTQPGVQRAIAAVRYSSRFDWRGQEADRDWWQAWAERGALAHTVAKHEAVIREALDHAAQPLPQEQPQEPPEGPGPEGPGPEGGDDDQPGGDEPQPGGSQPGDGKGEQPGEQPGGEPTESGEGGESTDSNGWANADGNGAGGGATTEATSLPECPSGATKRGDEEHVGAALAAQERSQRGAQGIRKYGENTVVRAYQSRRGFRSPY
jgi:hypothetical protein